MAGFACNSSSVSASEFVMGGLAIVVVSTSVHAGPTGAHVIAGKVNIQQAGLHTTITAGNNSIINFSSFNLSSKESVRFIQPDSSSRVLNRITSGAPTLIDGSIFANGRVFFVNPAGVTFGANSVVTANQIIAGAGTVSNKDFLRGVDRVTSVRGDVTNLGALNAQSIALLGRKVENFGSIAAPDGTVIMASGSDILIGRRRDRIYAKISAAGQAVGESGVAGGSVRNAGTIDAGRGTVSLMATDAIGMALFHSGSIRAAQVTLDSGAKGTTSVSGAIDATNREGAGGQVRVLGENVELRGATIDASGSAGGGQVLIGGNFHGGGAERTSQQTLVDPDTVIRADATFTGDAGQVVVWSDQTTLFGGRIFARAMGQGDGGTLEVSGKNRLGFDGRVEAYSLSGKNGSLLLDPRRITIGSFSNAPFPGTFSSFSQMPDTDLTVNASTIAQTIEGGVAVILRANSDINVDTAITAAPPMGVTGGALTLEAGRSINVNANISTGGGSLSLYANVFASPTDPTHTESSNSAHRDPEGGGTHPGNITIGANRSIDVGVGTLTLNIGPDNAGGFRPGALSLGANATLGGAHTVVGGTIDNSGSTLSITLASGDLLIDNSASITADDIQLTTNAGGMTLGTSASLSATNGIALSSTGGVSQGAGSTLSADTLTLTGAGNFTLTQAGNSVNTIAASLNGGGHVDYTNAGSIAVGTVGSVVGITTTNGSVALESVSGNVAIGQAITVGGAGKFLQLDGGATQLAGASIQADKLLLTGAGNFTLNESTNSVNTIAADLSGAGHVDYTNAGGMAVGTVGGTSGIATTNGSVSLGAITGAITIGAGQTIAVGGAGKALTLASAGGATEGAGASIQADKLLLTGSGNFTLTEATNSVNTFAANITGAGDISFSNAGALGVGTVFSTSGISTTSGSVSLKAASGGLTIGAGQMVVVGGAGKFLVLDGGTTEAAGASIQADKLLLKGSGNFALNETGNSVNTIAANLTGAGDISYTNAGALAVGSVFSTPGITTTNGAVTLKTVAGGITLGQATTVGGMGKALTLDSPGGATQSAGAMIHADLLLLKGASSFTLTETTNSVGTLAANITGSGALSFTNAGALAVGTVGSTSGLTTAMGDITLTTGSGAINIGAGKTIVAGGSGKTLTLASAGGATEGAGASIQATKLLLTGSGDFTLDQAGNTIGTVAANITGAVDFSNSTDLIVGTVGSTVGITTSGNNVTLSSVGNLHVTGGIGTTGNHAAGVSLTATGGIDQGNAIFGGALHVHSGGQTILTAMNGVTSIDGTPNTGLNFCNTGALTVNDITLLSGDVLLKTSGLFTLAGNIQAPAGRVVLAGAGATQNSGKSITSATLTFLGTGDFLLDGPNDVDTLAASVTGRVKFYDTDDVTVGHTTNVFSTANTSATGIVASGNAAGVQAISLQTGGGVGAGDLMLQDVLDAGLAQVSFKTGTGSISQTTGAITAGSLLTVTHGSAGTVTLNLATNSINTIAGSVGGAYSLVSDTTHSSAGITVGTLASPFADGPFVGLAAGATLGGANVTLTSRGAASSITVSNRLDASNGDGTGTSVVRLIADAMSMNATVTSGNSAASGVWVKPLMAGRGVCLGAESASKLSFSAGELAQFVTPLLQIGDGSTGAIVTTGALNLQAQSYNLILHGSGIMVQSITMGAAHDLTLWSEANGATANGQLVGRGLYLRGSGSFLLSGDSDQASGFTDAAHRHSFATLNAGLSGGKLVFHNDGNLLIDLGSAGVFADGSMTPSAVAFQGVREQGDVVIGVGQNVSSNTSRLTVRDPNPMGGMSTDHIGVLSLEGNVRLVTNNLTVESTVNPMASVVFAHSDVEIRPFFQSRNISIGGSGPDPTSPDNTLVINQDEIDKIHVGATNALIIGNSMFSPVVTDAIVIPTGLNNLTIRGSNVSINHTIGSTMAQISRLTIDANNIYQCSDASVYTSQLLLLGIGDILLTASDNHIGTLAGAFNGKLRLATVSDLTIGSINDGSGHVYDGLTSFVGSPTVADANSMALFANSIHIDQLLSAGALSTLVLYGATIDQSAASMGHDTRIVAQNLLLNASTIALGNANNSFDRFQAHGSSIALTGAHGATLGGVNDFVLSTPTPPMGCMYVQRPMSAPGDTPGSGNPTPGAGTLALCFEGVLSIQDAVSSGTVHLKTQGLTQTSAGVITAGTLWLENYGDAVTNADFNLGTAANVVTHLRGTLMGGMSRGNLIFMNADSASLDVKSDGLTVSGANAYIQAKQGLTVSGMLMADQVRLAADSMAINADVTGNGGILLRSVSTGRDVLLGGDVGTKLSLDQTELNHLISTTVVQIGGFAAGATGMPPVFATGQISTSNLSSALDYNLTLVGSGVSFGAGGLSVRGSSGAHTLALDLHGTAADVVQAPSAPVKAGELVVRGAHNVELKADSTNEVDQFAADASGHIYLASHVSQLTIDSLTGKTVSLDQDASTWTVTDLPETVGARARAADAQHPGVDLQVSSDGGKLFVKRAITARNDAAQLLDVWLTSDQIAIDESMSDNVITGSSITFRTVSARNMYFGLDSHRTNPGASSWVLSDGTGTNDTLKKLHAPTISVVSQANLYVPGADAQSAMTADQRMRSAAIDLTNASGYARILNLFAQTAGRFIQIERGITLGVSSGQPARRMALNTFGETKFGRSAGNNPVALTFMNAKASSRFSFGGASSPSTTFLTSVLGTLNLGGGSVTFQGPTSLGASDGIDGVLRSDGGSITFQQRLDLSGNTTVQTMQPSDFMDFNGDVHGHNYDLHLVTSTAAVRSKDNIPIRFNPASGNTISITGLKTFDVNAAMQRSADSFGDLSTFPTVVFGFDQAQTAAGSSVATELSATTVNFGRNERVLSFGNLTIVGESVTLADLNVVHPNGANLDIEAPAIVVHRHQFEHTPETGSGGLVVQGVVNLHQGSSTTNIGQIQDEQGETFIGVMNPSGSATSLSESVNSYAVGTNPNSEPGFPFAGLAAADSYKFLAPTGVPQADPSTTRAGATQGGKVAPPSAEVANITAKQKTQLEGLSIYPRKNETHYARGKPLDDLPRAESSGIAIGTDEIDPTRLTYTPSPAAYVISTLRLTQKRIETLLKSWGEIVGLDAESLPNDTKLEEVHGHMVTAWNAYTSSLPEGAKGSGPGFYGYLVVHERDGDPSVGQALGTIKQLRGFYQQLDQFGLSSKEADFPKSQTADLLGAGAGGSNELKKAIRGAAEVR